MKCILWTMCHNIKLRNHNIELRNSYDSVTSYFVNFLLDFGLPLGRSDFKSKVLRTWVRLKGSFDWCEIPLGSILPKRLTRQRKVMKFSTPLWTFVNLSSFIKV